MKCPNCGGIFNGDTCPYCDSTFDKESDKNTSSREYQRFDYSQSAYQYSSEKWYTKTWVIILFLLFFFPVGLFLLWRYKKWSIITKIVITVCVILMAIYGFFMTEETPVQNTYELDLNTEITMMETDFPAGKALNVFGTPIQF